MKEHRPVIGITMGDAAGIGPEIIMKALNDPSLYRMCRPLVLGEAKMLERAGRILRLPLQVKAVRRLEEADFRPGVVDCLDLDLLPADLPFGKVSAEAGNAAFRYLEKAVELAREGALSAICTAPLNKEALHKGGHPYPGHTEILAQLTGTEEYAMMLSSPQLKVIHVTTHVGLIDAIRRITPDRVYTVIRLAHETLGRAGFSKPRIGVCGINPHAGENGLFGDGEEEEKIVPAVTRARAEGILASGPHPADTLFYRAVRGDFDIVVAMYHDQGHVPVKVLGLEAGVNITVGLPILRTSVDHGTAFDIAGKGIADEGSLKEAIRQAVALSSKGNVPRDDSAARNPRGEDWDRS
ncbi:MAG: 4-hydroxythreonine-4-phosphate dehydrogenase PdxA [Planifilum sp.]|jgi:4-hydroxythreonine-4-phosphate dehydrogenase